MKIKGIQIIKSLNRGGAEILLYNLFENREFRDSNKLIVLSSNTSMEYEFIRIGVEVFCFPVFNRGINLLALYELIVFLRKQDVKYIHSHLPLAGIITRFCNLFCRFKSFYTEHNIITLYHPFTSFLNRISYFLETKIICCSEAVYESMPSLTRNKCIIIKNGINLNKFKIGSSNRIWSNLGSDTNPLIVTCIARFRPEKRHFLLMKAVQICSNRGYKVKLNLVGGGFTQKVINSFLLSNHNNSIEYFGELLNVNNILSETHIFSLSSSHEGLPISLLEAMSLGCIPICTSVGGIKEVIDKKYQISSVDEFEIPNLFADLYQQIILSTASELEVYSLNCINKIYNYFSIEITLLELKKLYD
jgi:L-malate glycosyltransferase